MLKPHSTVTANLVRARDLIADKNNWYGGVGTPPGRCAVTAVIDVAGIASDEFILLERAAEELFQRHPRLVNDELGHDAVMQVYGRAVELSLAEAWSGA